MMLQTCMKIWGIKFDPRVHLHLEKKCDFVRILSKTRNKSKYRPNATKLSSPFLCMFIEVSAKNKLKIQFLGRGLLCFGVFVFNG